MHLPAINIPELLLGLWRGAFDCDKEDSRSTWTWAVLSGRTWKEHGMQVAQCTPYLPGSFDRPPCNPAEKSNSGYKAWEWLLYLYGLGLALFYDVLPLRYWVNYCKLVFAIQVIYQRKITKEQLVEAHQSLNEFADEFEELYYQRKASRIHFCRPSIHTLRHLAAEVARMGPGICASQWTMERTIGNLGEEVKQHSNPFANLSQCGLRQSQVNALKSMIPDLKPPENNIPQGGLDLGDGYLLLRARDHVAQTLNPIESMAIKSYLQQLGIGAGQQYVHITRWARLHLPNGQTARSAWKESQKELRHVRISRNIKVRTQILCFPLLICSSSLVMVETPSAKSTITSNCILATIFTHWPLSQDIAHLMPLSCNSRTRQSKHAST
jgi:hypothetical protein